jgi:hypothetical protein
MTAIIYRNIWLIGLAIAMLGYFIGFIEGYYCVRRPVMTSVKSVSKIILSSAIIAFIIFSLGCASVESHVRPSGWCKVVTDNDTDTDTNNDSSTSTPSCELGVAASLLTTEKGKYNSVAFIGPSTGGIGGAYCPGSWCMGLGVGAPYDERGWVVSEWGIYAGVTVDIVELIKGGQSSNEWSTR